MIRHDAQFANLLGHVHVAIGFMLVGIKARVSSIPKRKINITLDAHHT